MGGVLTVNPNGTMNYTGRQQIPGVLTSRDLYGEDCNTCGGTGSLKVVAANGTAVAQTDCPSCDGTGSVVDA